MGRPQAAAGGHVSRVLLEGLPVGHEGLLVAPGRVGLVPLSDLVPVVHTEVARGEGDGHVGRQGAARNPGQASAVDRGPALETRESLPDRRRLREDAAVSRTEGAVPRGHQPRGVGLQLDADGRARPVRAVRALGRPPGSVVQTPGRRAGGEEARLAVLPEPPHRDLLDVRDKRRSLGRGVHVAAHQDHRDLERAEAEDHVRDLADRLTVDAEGLDAVVDGVRAEAARARRRVVADEGGHGDPARRRPDEGPGPLLGAGWSQHLHADSPQRSGIDGTAVGVEDPDAGETASEKPARHGHDVGGEEPLAQRGLGEVEGPRGGRAGRDVVVGGDERAAPRFGSARFGGAGRADLLAATCCCQEEGRCSGQ